MTQRGTAGRPRRLFEDEFDHVAEVEAPTILRAAVGPHDPHVIDAVPLWQADGEAVTTADHAGPQSIRPPVLLG